MQQKFHAVLVLIVILFTTEAHSKSNSSEAVVRQQNLDKLSVTIKAEHPTISHVRVDDLLNTQNAIVIDVREADEFAVSHIPGAVNITDREQLLSFVSAQQNPVVLYCSVGRRSALMTEYLQSQGVDHAANLLGSIFEWGNRGLALENTAGETHQVHPYNWYWGWQYLDPDLHAYP